MNFEGSCEGYCEESVEVRVSGQWSGQGHFVVKVEVDCEGHFVGGRGGLGGGGGGRLA